MWLYYWGFTERQVDLILMDQPVIVYDHDKKNKGGKGKSKVEPRVSSEVDVLETEAKWKQKKMQEGDKVDTGFLKAFGSAKKVKMYEQEGSNQSK